MSTKQTGSSQDPNAEKYLRHPGDVEGIPTADDQTAAAKQLDKNKSAQQKLNNDAHAAADKDIDRDPDVSMHSPNDDLDEGELARLGENFPV